MMLILKEVKEGVWSVRATMHFIPRSHEVKDFLRRDVQQEIAMCGHTFHIVPQGMQN